MDIRPFSPKQRIVLSWWCHDSPFHNRDAILCDGAARSGKTFCLGLSFFCWAMRSFHNQQFALCGKTIASIHRNLLHSLLPVLQTLGFACKLSNSKNQISVRFAGHSNIFYLFGGKDQNSASFIQGITLAGVLLDEVVLMPKSFVQQALARCSVPNAKFWFSCNPDTPQHWFFQEWIQKKKQHNLLYLHFSMSDNPSLDPATLQRYQQTFHGVFYQRYVLGEWAAAQGRVYDFWDETWLQPVPKGPFQQWRISCDYGTVNPTSMGLWALKNGTWFRVKEFYYDAKKIGRQKTDLEYAADLKKLAGKHPVQQVVVDPSAASFITTLRQQGWNVLPAQNDVLPGIRITAALLSQKKIVICSPCLDAIREFSLYSWDPRAPSDRVIKRFDHAMDEIRYFAVSVQNSIHTPSPAALSVERPAF